MKIQEEKYKGIYFLKERTEKNWLDLWIFSL